MKLSYRHQHWLALFNQASLGRKLAACALSKYDREHHEEYTGSVKDMAAMVNLWDALEEAWANIVTAVLCRRPIYPN